MIIRTLDRLIEVLTLQKQNLPSFLTQVGATAADVTAITNELNNLTAVNNLGEVVDAYKKTVFGIKQAMFNGDPDVTLTPFPAVFGLPLLVSPVAGSLKRTNDRNARFKAAPGYTHEIGVALGIESAVGIDTDKPIPSSVQPVIDVSPADTGYLCAVVVRNRQDSDMWQVLVRPVGSPSWTVAASATGKSVDFVYDPGANAGKPVQLEVRVQLKKNNEDYGQPSAIVQATVNP